MIARRVGASRGWALPAQPPSGAAERLGILTQPVGGVTGVALTTQPVIQALTANSTPAVVGGIVVTATLASGSGTLTGTTAVATNGATGRSTFTNLVITGTGEFTLLFTAPGLFSVTSGTITQSASNEPTNLGITTQPAGAVDGVAFTTQPVIQLRDAGNNPATVSGITVTASIGSGSGSLVGTTTAQTNSSGVATFSGLGIAGSGNHTVAFASAGLTGATSSTLSVAAATKLAMSTEPSGASTGQAFTTQPAVRLQTAANANVFRSGITVTAALASGTGSLGGTLTAQTNSSGIATFTNLSITGTGNHSIQFTSSGLTAVTSAVFGVSGSGFTRYANRPAGMTTLSDYGFSDAINAVSGDSQLGSSGWQSTFNANGNVRRVSDPTAPVSPNFVMEAHWPSGVSGGGGGQPPGKVGRALPGGTNRLYVAFDVWFDPIFEFHSASNKFLFVEPGNILLEHKHFSEWLPIIPAQAADFGPNIVPGYVLPLDQWLHIELYLNGISGQRRVQMWVDGVLITDYTGASVNSLITGGWTEMDFNGTWGGAGETKTRSSYRRIDHVVVATATT